VFDIDLQVPANAGAWGFFQIMPNPGHIQAWRPAGACLLFCKAVTALLSSPDSGTSCNLMNKERGCRNYLEPLVLTQDFRYGINP